MARIPTYPPGGPLDGTEDLYAVQSGQSVKISPKNILDYSNVSILRGKITKSISNVYGDFYSFDEMFTWLLHTPMISVDLYIVVQPGTYDITNDTVNSTLHSLIGSQLSSLTIRGVNAPVENIVLNSNNSIASKGFLTIKNMSLTVEDLTITNSGQPSFLVDATASSVTMNNVTFNDVEYTVKANSSNVIITDCTIDYSDVGIYLENSSTLEISGGIMDGGGSALAGVHAVSNATVIGRGNFMVTNSQYGLFLADGSNALLESHSFNTNTADYNIPFNVMQGDGGYVTDGNLRIDAGAYS